MLDRRSNLGVNYLLRWGRAGRTESQMPALGRVGSYCINIVTHTNRCLPPPAEAEDGAVPVALHCASAGPSPPARPCPGSETQQGVKLVERIR